MEGLILNFRRNRHSTYPNHMIISVEGVDNREKAEKLVGKKISWLSPGKEKKEIKGEIRAAHGNSGALRVIFEKGMPGQSIGYKIKIN
jgi:large subunit ribosomal protein L35Ae